MGKVAGFRCGWGLSGKLAAGLLGVLGVACVLLVRLDLAREQALSRAAEARADAELDGLAAKTALLLEVLRSSEHAAQRRLDSLADGFQANFAGRLALRKVRGRTVPVLSVDGREINRNRALVDRFAAATGAEAEVFVRAGDDFVRVATSVKNARGERDLGAPLERDHPAYAAAAAGTAVSVETRLFERPYQARYTPIRNAAGRLLGLGVVAVDRSAALQQLRDALGAAQIGRDGHVYLLDARPGAPRLLSGPPPAADPLLDGARLADILARKNGTLRYPAAAHERLAAFAHFAERDWLLVGSVAAEPAPPAAALPLARGVALALPALLLGVALLYLYLRRRVDRPLGELALVVRALAQGQTSQRIDARRRDPLGRLAGRLERIGAGFAAFAQRTRGAARRLAQASAAVAAGHRALAAPGDAAQRPAALLAKLDATLHQGADELRRADQLAQGAASAAEHGSVAVARVIDSMQALDASSRQIAEILGEIDGIAFQTNLLALNAAVEAARAGEQGRGFAVVAGEVRALAGRSAVAAQRIGTLLDDSRTQVEQGGALVAQAGEAMHEVLAGIRRVSEVLAALGAGDGERARGVAQLGEALAELERGARQRGAQLEALAGAAASLQARAQELLQAVDPAAPSVPAPRPAAAGGQRAARAVVAR